MRSIFERLHKILNEAYAENFSCLSHWKVRNPHPLYNPGICWTSPLKHTIHNRFLKSWRTILYTVMPNRVEQRTSRKILLLKQRYFAIFRELSLLQDKLAFIKVLPTLNSRISTQQILFFLRNFSHLHALFEPTRLFIFGENSYLHDY